MRERRDALDRLYSQCETPQAIYAELFGKAPTGDIEIVRTPIGLTVVCSDKDDLGYVFGESYSKFGPVKATVESTAGKVIKQSKVPGMECAVIALGTPDMLPEDFIDTKEILEHETQHSVHWLFQDLSELGFDEEVNPNLIADSFAEFKDLAWEDSVEDGVTKPGARTKLLETMREIRDAVYFFESDEVLAHLANGRSVNEIKHIVRGPGSSYKYNSQAREKVKEQLGVAFGDVSDKAFMGRGLADKVFGDEYEEIADNSMEGIHELQGKGYKNSEIIFMLQHHPMKQWRKVSRRI